MQDLGLRLEFLIAFGFSCIKLCSGVITLLYICFRFVWVIKNQLEVNFITFFKKKCISTITEQRYDENLCCIRNVKMLQSVCARVCVYVSVQVFATLISKYVQITGGDSPSTDCIDTGQLISTLS